MGAHAASTSTSSASEQAARAARASSMRDSATSRRIRRVARHRTPRDPGWDPGAALRTFRVGGALRRCSGRGSPAGPPPPVAACCARASSRGDPPLNRPWRRCGTDFGSTQLAAMMSGRRQVVRSRRLRSPHISPAASLTRRSSRNVATDDLAGGRRGKKRVRSTPATGGGGPAGLPRPRHRGVLPRPGSAALPRPRHYWHLAQIRTNFWSEWQPASSGRAAEGGVVTSPTYRSPCESRQMPCGEAKLPGAHGSSAAPAAEQVAVEVAHGHLRGARLGDTAGRRGASPPCSRPSRRR